MTLGRRRALNPAEARGWARAQLRRRGTAEAAELERHAYVLAVARLGMPATAARLALDHDVAFNADTLKSYRAGDERVLRTFAICLIGAAPTKDEQRVGHRPQPLVASAARGRATPRSDAAKVTPRPTRMPA